MDKTEMVKSNSIEDRFESVIDTGTLLGNRYQILRSLGLPSGQSDIYLCKDEAYAEGNSDFEYVIAKVYKSSIIFNQSVLETLSALESEYIVPVLDEGEIYKRRYEIMPYYEKGDLSRVQKIDESTLRSYVIPFINDALQVIHAQGLAHMDLKPSNIFIDDVDELYLGDFGICSVLTDASVKVTSAKGTLGYRPPESYTELSIKSAQFDYYSFGITLIHLWLGRNPFEGFSESKIMAYTLDGRVPIPEDMPDDLQLLVRGLTCYDKKMRLTYEHVKKWIDGEDLSGHDSQKKKTPRQSWIQSEQTYEFMGRPLRTVGQLMESLTMSETHWNEGIKRLKQGLFDPFFKLLGQDVYSAYLSSAVVDENVKSKEDDYRLAHCMFQVQVQTEKAERAILWKTKKYYGFEDLLKVCLNFAPQVDSHIREMCDQSFLETLLEEFGLEDEKKFWSAGYSDERLIEGALSISPNPRFNYKGDAYYSMDAILEKLMLSDDVLEDVDRLMGNSYFHMWLKAIGIPEVHRFKSV